MVAIDDPSKPLRSKVLAVPKYRAQYLANLKQLAADSLDWNKLGPLANSLAELIGDEIKQETRGIVSYEAFVATTSEAAGDVGAAEPVAGPGPVRMTLKDFVNARREYLLKYPAE